MTTTSHVGVTLLEASQAQKEVTVNEALTRIDALLNTGVIDRDLTAPQQAQARAMSILSPPVLRQVSGQATKMRLRILTKSGAL